MTKYLLRSLSPSPSHAVCVSIVSHGQLAMIQPLLEQLNQFSHAHIAKVVLTRNIPEAPLPHREWNFTLEQIENPSPMGFGNNHNQAFRHCQSDWFLILNPDIRLSSDPLGPLLANASDRTGILVPRIIEPGNIFPENHRAILTPLEIIRRNRPHYQPPAAPAWIPGLFMLFRSSAFRQVHGFDPKFFMYGEDFDISARLVLAKWEIDTSNDIFVTHHAQRASHREIKYMIWHGTSLLRIWFSRTFWRYFFQRKK